MMDTSWESARIGAKNQSYQSKSPEWRENTDN